jgi:hypothetical protein
MDPNVSTMQATPKKYMKLAYTKNDNWRPKARRKDDVENDIMTVGIVNWRNVEQVIGGCRSAIGVGVGGDYPFLGSKAIEEEEEGMWVEEEVEQKKNVSASSLFSLL